MKACSPPLHTLNPTPQSPPIRIKICGLTREQDVDAAVSAGADAIGFVLYAPSPRFVTPERAAQLAARLPPLVTPVLLFVNASDDFVAQACASVPGATLQFHGDESPHECRRLAQMHERRYWRAARIPVDDGAEFDLVEFALQYRHAQALILDAHSPAYGGSGLSFDWSRLPQRIPAHLVLSGGLNHQNVAQAMRHLQARGYSLSVDVSSGVEALQADGQRMRGIKDAARIQRFINTVRQAEIALQPIKPKS